MTPRRTLPLTRKLRYRLEHAVLVTVATILRALPLDFASRMMGRLWRVAAPKTRRHERVLRNLAIAFPKMSLGEREAIARQQWDNLGRTFAESFSIDRLVESGRVRLHVDPELERRVRSREHGTVVVAMHSANWEIAAFAIPPQAEAVGLYQALKNPYSDAYITGKRRKVFPGGLLAKSHSAPRKVMEHVRGRKAVAFLADHREGKGIPVSFFGAPTTANPFPAMVARRLRVPIVAGRVIRERGARFVVEAIELSYPVSEDPSADVAALTQTIQATFEAWIRERPGEWMWVHDRWKGYEAAARRGGDTA
ncbi:lysophospholipid acyltransferase family protein [Afifella pfennigii]|uniref:lysophospholipid acyltransferase family protein n=1 Tax=Afifella pfennigii TaxID=209897 RepID=UPI00068D6113|nr:hypothetical protein [Afifella pfennigii]